MNLVISALLFLAGVHYMILLLATCYRFIDLWYRIGEFWKGIVGTLLALIVFNAFITWMLPLEFKSPWIWGQVCYVVFHVVIFWFARLLLWLVEVKQR